MRQAHRCRRVGVGRFMVGEPAQLAHRDCGDGHDTDAFGPLVRATQIRDELCGRFTRPGIVPQQRISDNRARLVEAHHAVLLRADRYRFDIVEAANRADCGFQRRPPHVRVYFGAVGMRRRGRAHDVAGVRVADQHLARLGRRVDSGDEGHASDATPMGCRRKHLPKRKRLIGARRSRR
jgi:hypothetical protein